MSSGPATLHFHVHDDHRVTLAPSSRHCDASLPVFLKHMPAAADIDVAWWEFRQGVRGADLLSHAHQQQQRNGATTAADLMAAARNRVFAAPLRPPVNFSKGNGGVDLSAFLASSGAVQRDGERKTPATAATPGETASVTRPFEQRLRAAGSEREGAAASREALATIEATLAKYRKERELAVSAGALAASKSSDTTTTTTGGSSAVVTPTATAHTLDGISPMSDADGSGFPSGNPRIVTRSGGAAGEDVTLSSHSRTSDVVPLGGSRRPSTADDDAVRYGSSSGNVSRGFAAAVAATGAPSESTEMSGVETEVRRLAANRISTATTRASDIEQTSSDAAGGSYYYDPTTRSLQVVVTDRPQRRSETTAPPAAAAAGPALTVDRNSATSPALLDRLQEELARSADTPHPLDVADAARREQHDLELDALAERLDELEARPCSLRVRQGLAALRKRLNNAVSLQAIQRHEQDTLRMAQTAALLERALYRGMLERLQVVLAAAHQRVERVAALDIDGHAKREYLAEQGLLYDVQRALELAQEDLDGDDDANHNTDHE